MSLTDGKCMKPQDPRPMVATSFCVYLCGHEGEHSWADVQAIRTAKLRAEQAAEPGEDAQATRGTGS